MSVQLTIEKLIYGGDGLARLPADEQGAGKAAFVPFVLEGERVEAEIVEQARGFVRGKVSRIIESSGYRVDAACPYFTRCGGCHYQQSDYQHQLVIKAAILKENLRRIARLELQSELTVHPSPPWNYRNRARLKVQTAPQFAIGFHKLNSHELMPIQTCPISSPLINQAIGLLWSLGEQAESLNGLQEIELFADAADSGLLVSAYCNSQTDPKFAQRIAETLKQLSPSILGVVVFTADARSARARQIAKQGVAELTYKTRDASFRVSAGAFFQVNRFLSDQLVDLVVQNQSGTLALDLYAGVGLFAAVLNREFDHVIAVESSPTSYADLLYNSPAKMKAVKAMTEQYLKNSGTRLQPDLVVVDPPRGGLGDTVVNEIVALHAQRIMYVSCDPATLARDLRGLVGAGYRIERAHVVDLFPQTYHLESVFHLTR